MCRPLVFNHFATNTQSFSHLLLLFIIIEFIKVCIHRLREISATRNMKSRLAIKFPTPLWVVIKCPPFWAGKDVKCPGYARGDVEASSWLVHYLFARNPHYTKISVAGVTLGEKICMSSFSLGVKRKQVCFKIQNVTAGKDVTENKDCVL